MRQTSAPVASQFLRRFSASCTDLPRVARRVPPVPYPDQGTAFSARLFRCAQPHAANDNALLVPATDADIDAHLLEHARPLARLPPLAEQEPFVEPLRAHLRQVVQQPRSPMRHLACLLANLTRAWVDHPRAWVSYSATPRAYSPGTPYAALNLSHGLVRTINALKAAGLVEVRPGFKALDGSGRVSRVRTTPALWDWLGGPPPTEVPFVPADTVRLKDADKRVIAYGGDPDVERVLAPYNQLLQGRRVLLPAHRRKIGKNKAMFVPARFVDGGDQLYAVFNVDYGHGGRCYGGGWLDLSKEDRARIRIDGEAVIELDYSALHPRLLYAAAGVPDVDDPYAVPGFGPAYRRAVKLLLLTMINATDRDEAIRAAISEVIENRIWLPEKLSRPLMDRLVAAILAAHPQIAGQLFTGAGARLQRVDGDMIRRVLAHFAAKGEIVLPVHDSLIARRAIADELRAVMMAVAWDVGFVAQIK